MLCRLCRVGRGVSALIGIILAIMAITMLVCAGCSGASSNRTAYKGMSFVLPEDWTAEEADGKLIITAPEVAGEYYKFEVVYQDYGKGPVTEELTRSYIEGYTDELANTAIEARDVSGCKLVVACGEVDINEKSPDSEENMAFLKEWDLPLMSIYDDGTCYFIFDGDTSRGEWTAESANKAKTVMGGQEVQLSIDDDGCLVYEDDDVVMTFEKVQ